MKNLIKYVQDLYTKNYITYEYLERCNIFMDLKISYLVVTAPQIDI